MKILYQFPNPDTIYAGRSIFFGYKHAFEDLGYTFKSLTPGKNQEKIFNEFQPDIFFTSIGPLIFKYLNLDLVKKQKKKGMKVFINTPYWKSPISRLRINETPGISENKEWVKLISSGDFGDVYYNVCEQGDPKMDGFEKITGYKHHTILLAADKTVYYPDYSKKFTTDISYIGSNLPGKEHFFKEYVFPLKKIYNLKIYGQDWTFVSRALGMIQRGGQYFNIPIIKSLLKQPLSINEERKIYSSSIVSINIHEESQKKGLGNLNERTFKIIAAGGFEIVDHVPALNKYFKNGTDLIIAINGNDWFDKINYYIRNPEKRLPIIEAGKKKILKEHTYHNRIKQIIEIYNSIK